MSSDLQTTRADFALAVDRLDHAGRHGGLREFAGAEFTHEFRRQMLNESMALAVVRMEEKAKRLETEIAEIGEPAKGFVPTLTLTKETVGNLCDFLTADVCDRLELADKVEEFESVMGRFNAKLQRIKSSA